MNGKNKISEYKFSWQCPGCGWEPSDVIDIDDPELFYYIENGKAIVISNSWLKVLDKNGKWDGNLKMNEELFEKIKKEKNVKIYPIRDKWSTDYWTGGNDWRETQKCPNCNKEWVYYDGNY